MTELHKYFEHSTDYIWAWEVDEISPQQNVFILAVPHSFTIIYLNELVDILEFLSPQGVPNLGALLLSVLATGNNAADALSVVNLRIQKLLALYPVDTHIRNQVKDAFELLHKIKNLPPEYKTNDKRRLVFQVLFRDCHNKLSAARARSLIKEINRNEYRIDEYAPPFEFDMAILKRDFQTLSIQNKKFGNTQDIMQAIAKMLDEEMLAEYWDEEVIDEEEIQPKSFIDQLSTHPETFRIGTLIKRIWGGLRIPLHQQIPSGQPLGGISDMTNKGDFDRLLLSEFANDDDVFLSRIANQEALFIQREVPPQQDKITRYLLIDITLKNWGTPKIIAYALSLAIAKHPKNEITCKYFVLGNKHKEIYLEDLDSVIFSFKQLSSKLDLSDGLQSFFEEEKINDHAEIFILSSPNTIFSAANQQVLQTYRAYIHYLITADANGVINLYKYSSRNKRHLQTIQLPLEELWTNAPVKVSRKKRYNKDTTHLQMPLLLPLPKDNTNLFLSYGNFYVYRNGILYQFAENTPQKGFHKLLEGSDFSFGEFTILKTNQDKQLVYLDFEKDTISYLSFTTKLSKKFKLEGLSVSTKKVSLFVHDATLFMTDYYLVWKIVDGGNVIKVEKPGNHLKMFDEHFNKLLAFKKEFSRYRKYYSVVTRLDKLSTDYDDLFINGLTLSSEKFYKMGDYENEEIGTKHVNLILKRIDGKMLGVIKLIKEEFQLSLSDARNIAENTPGVLMENISESKALAIKHKLEETGAVCYTETTQFVTKDGSTINLKDGVLIFTSSNKSIPQFFVPFILNQKLAFATKYEFAGNPYFLPSDAKLTQIEAYDFFQKYVVKFIEEIFSYAS